MWLLAVARSEACRLEVGAAVGRERVHCRRAHNMTVIPREVWAPCDALEIVASSRSSQTWKLAVTLQTIGFSAKVCASRYTTLRRKESRRRWWRRWRWGRQGRRLQWRGGCRYTFRMSRTSVTPLSVRPLRRCDPIVTIPYCSERSAPERHSGTFRIPFPAVPAHLVRRAPAGTPLKRANLL